MLGLAGTQWPWMKGKPAVGIKEFGVSIMAACILGKPVNKAYQTSDFNQRPLSAGQLQYAALDAHVALRVHKYIMDHAPLAEQQAFAERHS